MPDILIRDVPDVVLAGIDAHASRLGLSRTEYLRRRLASEAATSADPVTPGDLKVLAELAADLGDDAVMGASWR